MNTATKYCSFLIGFTLLSGCASSPTALEQALAIPADTTSSISVDELLDRAILNKSDSHNTQTARSALQSNSQKTSALTTNSNEPSREQLLSMAAAASMQQPTNSQSSLLLTFMSDRAELTTRHQQQLARFAQRSKIANTLQESTPVKVECAPSAQANPYAAASTGMSRCLNVSRFLEKTSPHSQISLAPDLPANHIQISQ